MTAIRSLVLKSAVLIAIYLVLPIATDHVRAAELTPGVPFNTYLAAKTYASIAIQVPQGATRLTVTTTNGSEDLDLYLAFGSPPPSGLGSVAALDAATDAISDGPTAAESITLTPTGAPRLGAGT
jgi:hypothetical protein